MDTFLEVLKESQNELFSIQNPGGDGSLNTEDFIEFDRRVRFKEYIPNTTPLPKTQGTKEVPLKDLVSTQKTVFVKNLNRLLKNKKTALEKPILVTRIIKDGGRYLVSHKYYIIDGHHRVVMAALLKKDTILVDEISYPEGFNNEE